ncbi:hypothetical protein GCM10010978_17800 [Compostibacillus humi]|uniref:DUF1798 family protein n=1 Tax=Compostibacillus humi TaxID=1245525 RepID=A0A8J2TMK3_9BACI|nr:DUF1798 family protein [Compostibacillus humi]GFZ76483.1 hypothetical protein GCM10010978_17800 [Compostibacillus humi]
MDFAEMNNKLYEQLEHLKSRYETASPPEDLRDRDFFLKVKEAVTPIYSLLDNWEEEALKRVQQQSLSVHPQQIASTRENMELIAMHSYYKDVKRKRYMELYHSILYIINQMHGK